MTQSKFTRLRTFRFACPDCGSVHQISFDPERICERCGTMFRVKLSVVRNGGGRFCSRACQHAPRPLIPHPTDPTVVIVPLTQGKEALIDAADAEDVGRFNWCASWTGKAWYAKRTEKGKLIPMHRHLLAPDDSHDVDHWNRNTLDNRRQNLRPVTPDQNGHNTPVRRNNASGFRGVCWSERDGAWLAYISVNGRRMNLGRFTQAEDAARARDAKARELLPDYAHLNFPDE